MIKELTGICRLVIKKATKEHADKYTCKIDKQDAKTTCTITFVGNVQKHFHRFAWCISFGFVAVQFFFLFFVVALKTKKPTNTNKQNTHRIPA